MNKFLVGGIASAALLLTATASFAAGDKYNPKIVEAAKKEGEIVVYSSTNRATLKQVCKGFEKKFGIKTHCTRKSTSGVTKMVSAEQMAGKLRCDILSVGDTSMFSYWEKNGLLEPYKNPMNVKHVSQRFIDKNGYSHQSRFTYFGIGVNSKLVAEKDRPKDWTDVLDPKWKGKIGIANPKDSGPGRLWLSGMVSKYGWEFIEKLAKQKPLMIKSSSTAYKMLVSGEVLLTIPGSEHSITKRNAQKAPVALVYPKSGVYGKDSRMAICKGAKHPNAARLWIDYVTSKAGQAIMTKYGAYPPIRTDVPLYHKRPDPSALNDERVNWITNEHLEKEGPKERKKFEKIMRSAMGS
ncbi:MAG: extracellular solute-binding protein [Rhodospirillales bacterium]